MNMNDPTLWELGSITRSMYGVKEESVVLVVSVSEMVVTAVFQSSFVGLELELRLLLCTCTCARTCMCMRNCDRVLFARWGDNDLKRA